MVSFNCEACNDVVKKPKLDAHKGRCPGAVFTCIDCSTTFQGTAYKEHTSCISEDQKYQGALYKPEKGKGKKGKQQKQEEKVNGSTPATNDDKSEDVKEQPKVEVGSGDVEMKEADGEPTEEKPKAGKKEKKSKAKKEKKDKKDKSKEGKADSNSKEPVESNDKETGENKAEAPTSTESMNTEPPKAEENKSKKGKKDKKTKKEDTQEVKEEKTTEIVAEPAPTESDSNDTNDKKRKRDDDLATSADFVSLGDLGDDSAPKNKKTAKAKANGTKTSDKPAEDAKTSKKSKNKDKSEKKEPKPEKPKIDTTSGEQFLGLLKLGRPITFEKALLRIQKENGENFKQETLFQSLKLKRTKDGVMVTLVEQD